MVRSEPQIYMNKLDLYQGQQGHFFTMKGYRTVELLVIRARENPYLSA